MPGVSTLALCVRVVRRDGVALASTTADRAMTIAGTTYRPRPGLAPSALVLSTTASDAMELRGSLSTGGVTREAIEGGAFDRARVTAFFADWTTGAVEGEALVEGLVAGAAHDGARFTLAVETRLADTARPMTERYAPHCRAELGDARCRVDLAARTTQAVVSAVTAAGCTVNGATLSDGALGGGQLRVLSGRAAGAEVAVAGNTGNALTLAGAVAGLAGARVRLRPGCDKRWATCVGRYANERNFRGEPHVPGDDAMGRYADL